MILLTLLVLVPAAVAFAVLAIREGNLTHNDNLHSGTQDAD